jgi:hypothetical protein
MAHQGIYTDIFKKLSVFSLKDLDKQGDIKILHDKEIGKRVLKLSGDVSSANFIRIPSLHKKPLHISGKYFIIEYLAPLGSIYSFHLEFDVPNLDKVRLSFCNIYKSKKILQNKTVQIPLEELSGKWTYLIVDLKSYLGELYLQDPVNSHPKITVNDFKNLNFDFTLKSVELCSKMSVRSCWMSDVKYFPSNIPKEQQMLLGKNENF